MSAGPFSIGSALWPGISKLVEEAGEVSQVCGKLIGSGGEIMHWDGTNLKERLEDEIADVLAACFFVAAACNLDAVKIDTRMKTKLETFSRWHKEQA
jgi:NTP pyrophosphatase (non-canonical NTP hydrolase)